MDVGVHAPMSRAYTTQTGMPLGHSKLHSAAPSLAHSQTHTSSSYSIQSQPSSRSSDTTQGTAQSTLFPPPSSVPPMVDGIKVRADTNVMNRVGDKEQSLFQICVILRERLMGVPGFERLLQEEEQGADEDTDPVTLLWRTFRRGYPLLALYNVLRPDKPIQPDLSTISSEVKKGKAMTFKFLNACIHDLKFKVEECFIILDLYGDDTTGFVKVTKTVTRLLDILVDQGIIEDTRRDSAEPTNSAVKRSQRQHIVDELVTTERTYVQQLELLQAYQLQCQKTGVVPGDVVHQVFLNLNALLDFQRRFLIRVEQINAMPESEQNWGKLFILYNDAFKIYEPYITNQKQCEETVMREFEQLRQAGGSPELQGIVANPSTLYSFLMKPFQRLSKYPLLLNELHKKGDLDEERKSDLLIGKECASAVLARTNAAMEREDRVAAVHELKGRVEDWKGHRVEGFGELLLFGTFTVIKSDSGPGKDSEREYHVYFFGSILLCCKDIDPSKAKNKMKGKPMVDKKGKPKLQLKGRIFMQNVTDVISTSKQGSYTCQIFWKGDPGIENFTIRFLTEDTMQKWYNMLLEQKKRWSEMSASSDQRHPSVSATEFTYMQNQSLENPYREQEDEEDIDMHSMLASPVPYSNYPAETSGWNMSSSTLRSRSATNESGPPGAVSAPGSGRVPHPRFAPGTMPAPPLSLKTQPQNTPASPGPNFGESYFSPIEESPMSSRTSTSSGMYFPRHQGNGYEGGHERYTAPLPYRSASREAMNGYPQNARGPSRPTYPPVGGPQQSVQGNRNRSVSSPNINEVQRRAMNSSRPPMPEGPLPSHLGHPATVARSQSNSPHLSNNIDGRMGTPPSMMHMDRPQTKGQPVYGYVDSRTNTPVAYRDGMMSPALPPATPALSDAASLAPPSQLKVKVHATAAGQMLTLVVPGNISYQSLRDRIDAKLQRSTNISLSDRGGNQVKLKYLDDDDYVNIASDEDVQTAFETWREQRGEGISGMGEIELFCQ